MADQSVGEVRVAVPKLSIPQSIWDASGFQLPILLSRNVTIQGPPGTSSAEWPILDFEHSKAVMQLAGNVSLHFRYVFLKDTRDKATRAPGLDILAPTAAGELSTTLIGPNAAASFSLCWPLAQQAQDFSAVERPKQFPGTNMIGVFDTYETLKQEGCLEDPTAPLVKRCWGSRYQVLDLAAIGADYDELRDILVPNNQIYHILDTMTYCETLVDERCYTVEGKPLLLCYTEAEKAVFERQRAASSPSGSASVSTPPPPKGGDALASSGSATLSPSSLSYKSDDDATGGLTGGARVGVIVGASAAGVLLLAVSLAVAVAWTRRRRQLRGTAPDVVSASAARKCGGGGGESGKHDGRQQQDPQRRLRGPDDFADLSDINGGGRCAQAGEGRRDAACLESSGPSVCVDGGDSDSKEAPGSQSPSGFNEQRNIKIAAVAAATPQQQRRQSEGLPPVTPLTPPRPEVALTVQLLEPPLPPPEQPHTPAQQQSPMQPLLEETMTKGGDSNALASSGVGGGSDGSSPPVVELLPVVLGKGCFGRVVEGTFGGQRVAVKLLVGEGPWGGGGGGGGGGEQEQQEQQEQPGDAGGHNFSNAFLQSFVQEVQVLSRVQHPNVVRLLAACVTPPRLCLVMELMEASLEKVMYGKRTAKALDAPLEQDLMPFEKVLHIGIEIANALAYLHPTIVHRDLKPANVLINGVEDDQPVVKLSDFGLSRLRFTVAPTKHPDAGTPPYMAPECFDISNNCITHQSDMYSLGVLLWEMLAGTQPWAGVTPVAIAFLVTYQGQRLPLSQLDEKRCPPKLARLLKSCWESDPARRPAAAEAAKQMTLVLMEVRACVGSGS